VNVNFQAVVSNLFSSLSLVTEWAL